MIWEIIKSTLKFIFFIAVFCTFLCMYYKLGFEISVIIILTLIFTNEVEHNLETK